MELPEEFYREEIRCGYTVSEKMKKVWAVELELLEKFIEVCERSGLNYFLDGGTLLGAVRHGGFIPWDDDIDVIMPRKDYDRLFEIAEKEFQHPFFFQTSLTENGFFRAHAQLRNSDTTGFIDIDREKDINKGIFMDIFVLDNIPAGRLAQWTFRHRIQWQKKVMWCFCDRKYEDQGFKGKVFWQLVHIFFRVYPFKKYFVRFNRRALGRYQDRDTSIVGDVTLAWRSNVLWPRAWYDGYTCLTFEGLQARVPLCYREVLTRQYGDYMRLPADVGAMNGRCHGEVCFEPDIPYTAYFAALHEPKN